MAFTLSYNCNGLILRINDFGNWTQTKIGPVDVFIGHNGLHTVTVQQTDFLNTRITEVLVTYLMVDNFIKQHQVRIQDGYLAAKSLMTINQMIKEILTT